jgi:PAS domain S-box-containing protein
MTLKRLSLKQYFEGLTLIPLVILAFGMEAYFLHDRYSDLDNDLIDRSKLIARQLASSSEYGVFANNIPFLKSIAQGVLQQPDVRGVSILNSASGNLVEAGEFHGGRNYAVDNKNLLTPENVAPNEKMTVNKVKDLVNLQTPVLNIGNSLLIYQPIISEQVELDDDGNKPAHQQIGAVIIEIDLEGTRNLKLHMFWQTAGVTALFLLLSIYMVLLTSRRITTSIFELNDAVQMIGKGNLHTRVALSSNVTELNSLARGINAMTAQLQLEHTSLHQRADEAIRLAAIAFESNEGMIVSDTNNLIMRVNKAFINITGYSESETIGKTPSLLKSDLHDADFYTAMWTSINNSGSWQGEIWNKRKNGEPYLAWLTITVVKNEDGKVANYIASYTDITERQRLQAETATLLRRNHAFMKNAIDGIHILDVQGNIVEANDSFCRMLGYTQEEVTHLNVADWDRNWSAKELRERIEWLSQDGVSSTFETKHCRKDGTLIDIEISCTGMEIEGQHYLFASSRDITSRKQAENMLRIAAATFETHEAIMITDADANIIRVNHAFQDITGYTSEEVRGKNPRILSSGRHEKAFYESMWEQLLNTGSWTGEIWDKRKNGQIYPKLLTITAIKNDNQETTQYVGIFRDITERKKAEEALLLKSGAEHRRAEELRQELGNLLKNSFNEIYIFDADSLQFLLTSEGAEKNLGYSSEELTQLTPLDLCPSIAKENFGQMLTLLSSGQQESLFFETNYHRKNGTTYPVEGRLQFINLDIPVFMAIIQDITEHKSAESELRNLSMHLQNVREDEKASIAREIHDHLGGTLTALKMDINWLMDEMAVNKEASSLLKQVESMSQLVDDASKVARRVIADLRPTILDDLGLCAALEWQADQFQRRTNIQCSVTCCTENCKFELNKMQTINLFRIFQESLTNVARHSGASRVEAELQMRDEEIILAINDNGRGLKEGHVSQTSFGMLGMRERVEQIKGKISFNNRPGGGLSVTVILPLLDDYENEAQA